MVFKQFTTAGNALIAVKISCEVKSFFNIEANSVADSVGLGNNKSTTDVAVADGGGGGGR